MFSCKLRSQLTHSTPSVWRGFATTATRDTDFTHAVIGGGAVGLAIARQLASKPSTSTLLIERNSGVGQETSSRNSEVIHGGLYYGPTSLKTRLCIQGRQMLYSLCQTHQIPHMKCGKWIVAQTNEQWEELVKVQKFTRSLPDNAVPTEFVSLDKAAKLEPDVRAAVGVLESPETGIVDSHALMQFLLSDFEDRGGDVAYHSPVTAITPLGDNGSGGWEITTKDKASGESNTITAEILINSAGLGAVDINNLTLPPPRHQKAYYAKGNYFSYSPGTPTTKRLIYPAPEPGLGGLGTHLTLDISGRIRFGPDVEWVDSPTDLAVNESRLPQAIEQIRKFFPGVKPEGIQPDYAGIRPKLGHNSAVASGKNFQDFWIKKEEGVEGFVNLMGIESPGLTSCLAIGEMVERLVYR